MDLTIEIVAEVRGAGRVGFSGVVVERGDEVFGALEAVTGRIVVVPSDRLAPKPPSLSHPEAAALAAFAPAVLSALQRSAARPGDRVLITGASDDAGAIAVQIARLRGIRVTAVCRDRDVPLVWDLGADEVLADDRDPRDSGPFSAVIDTDHSVTPELADRLLRRDGTLIAIDDAAPTDGAPDELVELVERDRVFPVIKPG
jgi:NADPH:quinone reductase-like Zn-dependent oxidoreductase